MARPSRTVCCLVAGVLSLIALPGLAQNPSASASPAEPIVDGGTTQPQSPDAGTVVSVPGIAPEVAPSVTLEAEPSGTSPVGFGAAAGAGNAEQAKLDVKAAERGDIYGVYVAAALTPENLIFIDGVPVGYGGNAGLPRELAQNYVLESIGLMPEFARTEGGVTLITSKSGNNEFHASVFSYFDPPPDQRPPLPTAAEAIAGQTNETDLRLGVTGSGPLLKDRLWFYIAFLPTFGFQENTRFIRVQVDRNGDGLADVDPRSGYPIMVDCRPGGDPSNPDPKAIPRECNGVDTTRKSDGTPNLYNSHFTNYLGLAKINAAISSRHSVAAELFATSNAFTAPFQLNPDAVTWSNYNLVGIGAYSGKFFDQHLLVDALVSGSRSWTTIAARDITVRDDVQGTTRSYNPLSEPQVVWANEHSLLDFENDPNTRIVCTDPAGASFRKCPEVNRGTGGLGWVGQPVSTRLYGRLTATALFDLLGFHTLKLGTDYDRSGFSVDQKFSGQTLMRERYNPFQGGNTFQDLQQFGVPNDQTNPDSYTVLDHLTSRSAVVDFGMFLQDSLRIAKLVTIDAGIRWELQQLYGATSDSPIISLADNFAPRFRLTVDPTRSGRAKIYGYWGRYFASIPGDLADRVFGNAHAVVADHSPCVAANPLVAGDPSRCPVIPGSVVFLSQGQAAVAPDLKGQFSDVWGFGAAYEVLPDLTVQLHYTDSRVVRAIDTMSLDDGRTFFVANPGESQPAQVKVNDAFGNPTLQRIDGIHATPTFLWPKPERHYQALTLSATKNATRNWDLYASYTLSRLEGNYRALFYDAGAGFDPTRNNEYNVVALTTNKYGLLPGDRTHRIRLATNYTYDISPTLSATAGGGYQWESGYPINALAANDLYGPSQSYLLPRGSMGRTIPFWQIDVRGGVEWLFSRPYRVAFYVECQNVTDRVAPTSVSEDYTFQSEVAPIPGGKPADLATATTTSGTPVIKNPNFGNVTSWQLRRSFHFNLAVSF